MAFDTLIVSSDAEVVSMFRSVLLRLGSELHYSSESDSTFSIIARKKVEAVIIDFSNAAFGVSLLRDLRLGDSNQDAVVLALPTDKAHAKLAFDHGANFILNKPFSSASLERLFATSEQFLKAQRRFYFRHAVSIPVDVYGENTQPTKAVITALSEGGMGVQFSKTMKFIKSQVVKVCFRLPLTEYLIEIKGEIAWITEADRKAGLRFYYVPKDQLTNLQAWLAKKVD